MNAASEQREFLLKLPPSTKDLAYPKWTLQCVHVTKEMTAAYIDQIAALEAKIVAKSSDSDAKKPSKKRDTSSTISGLNKRLMILKSRNLLRSTISMPLCCKY